MQPKTGELNLQAAVDSGSAGRSRSSREQAAAYYTSVKQANRRETVEALHWDQGSSLAHAAKRASQSLARSTEAVPGCASEQVRCKRQVVAHTGSGRGPAGPRQQWTATRRQQPAKAVQLASSKDHRASKAR